MLKKLALAAGGVLVGLVLAEAAFWVRDDGAFPHVNFYVPDATLGVRLAPHAGQRIAFGGNPTTSIATNGAGYRTPAWPETSADEVLVVGDSQVFGLGVDEGETLAAYLSRGLGRTVLNGGVPTYGPAEYLAVVDEIAGQRDVTTVVVVVNYSNDLFEVSRPNVERHAVWDGWAVRSELAPRDTVWFPGRSWLYGRSHLFFALRRFLHQPSPTVAGGLPSEGTVSDVLRAAVASASGAEGRKATLQQQEVAASERYREALASLDVEDRMLELYVSATIFRDRQKGLAAQAVLEGASVGDIVTDQYAEASRSIPVTAELLAEGARVRRELRRELAEIAVREPGLADEVAALLRVRGGVPDGSTDLAIDAPAWPTPLDATLDRLNELAARHGFTPVVVALPLDVQVLPSQFAKYDAEPVDMADTIVLFDDLARAGAERGIRVAQPLSALRELGDDAFLDGDLHLTGAGHAAVAGVVQRTILGPPPPRPPSPGIPEGRSRVPWEEEWNAAGENLVRGSSAARCATRRIREWFRMDCRPTPGRKVVGLRRVDAPLETHGWYDGTAAVLIAPVLPGRSATVDVIWDDHTERFAMSWDGDVVSMALSPTAPATPEPGVERQIDAVLFEPGRATTSHRTLQWIGAGSACEHATCLFGSRLNLPDCPDGTVNAGSAGHCFVPCTDACDAGVCTPWGTGSVCL